MTGSNQQQEHHPPKDEPDHTGAQSLKPRYQRLLLSTFWYLKDQWFLFCIGLVILIASQIQVPLSQQATKQVIVSYLSVTIIFFTAGCTLSTRSLLSNYSKWKHHIFIQTQCFLLVSALAFAVAAMTGTNHSFMDPWLLIGLVFNGCQPTAMASNVLFTRQSHGNATLTVVETTIGNLLGPFITPVLIKMYLSTAAWWTAVIPSQNNGYAGLYRRVFMQFGLSIYLPMAVGQIFRYYFPTIVQRVFIDWKLTKLGSFAMLSLLWQTFDHAFATSAFESLATSNIVFIVFISVANYFVWLSSSFGLCLLTHLPHFTSFRILTTRLFPNVLAGGDISSGLSRQDTVSIVMTTPAKTLALGIPISFLMFEGITPQQESKIQLPMLIFQVVQMGLASLGTLGFRRWVDAEQKAKGKGGKAGEGGKDGGGVADRGHDEKDGLDDDEKVLRTTGTGEAGRGGADENV